MSGNRIIVIDLYLHVCNLLQEFTVGRTLAATVRQIVEDHSSNLDGPPLIYIQCRTGSTPNRHTATTDCCVWITDTHNLITPTDHETLCESLVQAINLVDPTKTKRVVIVH